MPKRPDINSVKESLILVKPDLARRFGVRRIGVFGSVARGEATEVSDIDILIDYEPSSHLSLFDIVILEDELSELFGKKADIVTLTSLKRNIGERILREVQFV